MLSERVKACAGLFLCGPAPGTAKSLAHKGLFPCYKSPSFDNLLPARAETSVARGRPRVGRVRRRFVSFSET